MRGSGGMRELDMLARVECESLLSLAYLTSKLAFNSLARLTNLAHQLSRKHLQECAKGGSSESL